MPTARTVRRAKPKSRTWEHPAGSGIKISELPNKTGGKVFGVSYRVRIPAELLGKTGIRETHQKKTLVDAERFAEDRLLALKTHGTSFADLPPKAQKEAAMAWGLLSTHGVSFIEAAEVATKLKKHGLDFHKAVDAAVSTLLPSGGQRTLAEVLVELRTSKAERCARGELDTRTRDDFKSRSLKIETALGSAPIATITGDDLAKWLRQLRTEGLSKGEKPLSQRSVLNYRNTLAEVFRHAKARRYCEANPLEFFTREDYKGLGGERAESSAEGINILKVAEVEKLLRTAADTADLRGLLPSLVLRLFCGLRTAEVCRLEWHEVRWTDAKPFVHIPASKAKKRRIRLVDIPANALAWLSLCNPPANGLVVPGDGKVKGYCKRFARLVRVAELSDWGNNDTRHSFGSYHYALHGDAVKTSAQMGHKQGDDVLFSHYRQLVTGDDAAQFFALRPDAEVSKIVAFPQAAS